MCCLAKDILIIFPILEIVKRLFLISEISSYYTKATIAVLAMVYRKEGTDLNVEIVTTIIGGFFTLTSVLLSLIVSLFVSRWSTNNEIKKIKILWEYDDRKIYDKEFSEMITAVSAFDSKPNTATRANAIEKINIIRLRAKGNTIGLLNLLYAEIATANMMAPDWWKIEKLLGNLVDEYVKERTGV